MRYGDELFELNECSEVNGSDREEVESDGVADECKLCDMSWLSLNKNLCAWMPLIVCVECEFWVDEGDLGSEIGDRS